MASEVKVQASTVTRIGDVIFDLVSSNGLVAQDTWSPCAVPGIDARREHDRQPAALDVSEDAGAEFALWKHWLGRHAPSCRRLIEFLLNAGRIKCQHWTDKKKRPVFRRPPEVGEHRRGGGRLTVSSKRRAVVLTGS
jgi:hypothetical protein